MPVVFEHFALRRPGTQEHEGGNLTVCCAVQYPGDATPRPAPKGTLALPVDVAWAAPAFCAHWPRACGLHEHLMALHRPVRELARSLRARP